MVDSILLSIKKTLGLDETYTAFDEDVIMHINSALGTLNQLGIGPELGFEITDDTTTWDDFLGNDPRYNPAKSYVHLRLRLLFDPPIGYVLASMEKQKEELEWRLNAQREYIVYPIPPEPLPTNDDDPFYDFVVDGGNV